MVKKLRNKDINMKIRKILTIVCSVFVMAFACGALSSCEFFNQEPEVKTTAVVSFDVNTDLQTNSVKNKTVTIGKRVSKPGAYIVEDNPTNLQVYGWYTTADCTTQWDFKNDRVQEDMTLYAKWVELKEVNYYVNGEFLKTENAFKGDLIKEDAMLVEGFKYLGTYVDEEFTQAYDYATPVSETMNIYLKRSEGIYLTDMEEEGQLSSGKLTDYLAAYVGSYTLADESKGVGAAEEGWVEERKIITNYESGPVEENCTYVNFGYTPLIADPFVEISRGFDIRGSQTIRIYFKNLGSADRLTMYFTAMLDVDNGVYSETGATYSAEFCFNNAHRSELLLSDDMKNMDESDEWVYLDFNLHEIYKYGYSIWGTSPYLGAIRLEANYTSKNADDWSNEFLIKAIEGLPETIEVKDSEQITQIYNDGANTTAEELKAVSDAQASIDNGFVFPKDGALAGDVTGEAELCVSKDGLLFKASNEIACRENNEFTSGFSVVVPEGKAIDLENLTTFNIKLRNYGYAKRLIVYVYNDEGVPVKTEFEINPRMSESKNYSVNLFGEFGMYGNLTRVEVLYESLGVDNLLLVESISFTEFVPYDTVGINFNDKFFYGFTSTSDVSLSYDGKNSGTKFTVAKDGATLVSPDKTYEATNDGYANAVLTYVLPRTSDITAVNVQFKVNGEFGSNYRYELDLDVRNKVASISLPFALAERGMVQALKLSFEGTGEIILKEIGYTVNEDSLPYYKSYASIFNAWQDWLSTGTSYEYDAILKASILKKADTASMLSSSLYIGFTTPNGYLSIPHTTYNVPVVETTVIKIVYQNKTNVNTMNVWAGWANKYDGNPDTDGYPQYEVNGVEIDCNMADYEWSTLVIELPDEQVGKFVGKLVLQFGGKEIAIRAITFES